jgi:hypothetical protein
MPEMIELTPHDSATLNRLARFVRLPAERRQEILSEIEAEDARRVGEVLLDPLKYSEAGPEVQATVDHFHQWMEANRHLAREREKRRQAARARRMPPALASQP